MGVASCKSRPAKMRRCVAGAGLSGCMRCSIALISETLPPVNGTTRRRADSGEDSFDEPGSRKIIVAWVGRGRGSSSVILDGTEVATAGLQK